MAILAVTENITLDGVIEDPENWANRYQSEDLGQHMFTRVSSQESVLLFGRKTYEKFAAFWPTADIEPFASKMNNSEKYVVSRTLDHAPWGDHSPATVIGADLAADIASLKQSSEHDIAILGSGKLVESLVAENLVDELHLYFHPLVLGAGQRLFESSVTANFQLANSQSFSGGVVLLTYRPDTTR